MTLSLQDSLDAYLKRSPTAARALDSLGIDYCCGGARSLERACRDAGLDPVRVAGVLDGLAEDSRKAGEAAALNPAELAEHIEASHHVWLRRELPALEALTGKVARVHGSADPRLVEVRDLFHGFAEELSLHMQKEEQVLFPAIRELHGSGGLEGFHCGSLANPIAVMEAEHADAAEALARLRGLTGGYAVPDWACASYRSMLERLEALDLDLQEHIRKEEALLFPRALEMERSRVR